jgi:hypothetical protein
MTKWRSAAVLCAALFISACRGDDDGSSGPVAGPVAIPEQNPAPQPEPTPQPEPEPNSEETPAPAPPPTEGKTPVPTAVGTPLGEPVSKIIGVSGGELATADGAITVIVPAGAFAKDETVTIQEITNEAHGALGRAFRITPEGLNTPVPMTVRFSYSELDLAGTTLAALGIAYQEPSRAWRVYTNPTIDTTNRTLSVQTRHFSDWSRVRGVQLVPNAARVTAGNGLDLHVLECDIEPVDEDGELNIPMPGMLVACEASPLLSYATKRWAVNGVEGGTPTTGTIAPNADRWIGKATYTAPATKPTPSVVAVSAEFDAPLDNIKHLLVANITIDEELSCESFRNQEMLNAELSFDPFSFVKTAQYHRHTGTHSGKLIGTLTKVDQGGDIDFGVWVSYRSPLLGGNVSVNDQYQYTPPDDTGYSGTAIGNGPPHDSLQAPSYIGLRVYYDTCTFDLFGAFFVDGSFTRNGASISPIVSAGGLQIFGLPMPPEQAATMTLEGSRVVPAENGEQQVTGYVPWNSGGGPWTVSGGTTVHWRIWR